MSNPLEDLIGLRVTKSEIVHDYAMLTFGNFASLRIINDYTVNDDKSVIQLTGLALVSFARNAEEVILTFEDRSTLNVSLKPSAYRSPEAMVLDREGKPIVVWN